MNRFTRLSAAFAVSACFALGTVACGTTGAPGSTFDAGEVADSSPPNDDANQPTLHPDAAQPDSGCVPKTCSEIPANCGPQTDGCGGLIDGGCGTCTGYETCGGGGTPNMCGGCIPKTCADQGIECGPAGDGCGGTLNCYPGDAGSCGDGGVCGGGGPFKCGPATVVDGGGGDAAACVPATCAPNQCGATNDGCGHALDCGGCDGGTCGYPTNFFCGYPPDGGEDGGLCVPKTCASQGINCGLAGDGCGWTLNCWPDAGAGVDGGSCADGGMCGILVAGQCGAVPLGLDGGSSCAPSKTCAGLNCGYIDDGCGNLLDCWPDGGTVDAGAKCGVLSSCGGGGVPNVCGGSPLPPDGGSLCVPLSCAAQHISCGAAGDGCGNTINCYPDAGSACAAGSTCEAVDGGSVACVTTASLCTPTTCAAQHIYCGTAGNGCGGSLNCNPGDAGSCGDGGVCETVDGGAVECVFTPACTKTTCGALGYNCGFASDNCGGLLNCNPGDAGCAAPEYCGGGGTNVCGVGFSPPGDAGSYVSCSGGTATSISGFAYAATNPAMFTTTVTPDPLAGAYVWVPNNGVLPPITPGVVCEQCTDPPTALAVAITGADGGFTLPNVPVVATSGTATVPIIVQVGRWAKLTTVNVTPCEANTITGYNLRLPRTGAEGNMPWFAVDTGELDSLECVLLKMGIDPSMFASPATVLSDMDAGAKSVDGGTRVAIYTSPDTIPADQYGDTYTLGGALAPDNTNTSGANLYSSASTLNRFDAVLFPCVGAEVDKAFAGAQENVVNYANSGGRVFATHYSYVWLMDVFPQAQTALGGTPAAYGWGCTTDNYTWEWYGYPYNSEEYVGTDTVCDTAGQTVGQWDLQQAQWDASVGIVDTTSSTGQTFAQWMVDLNAATLSGPTSGTGGVIAGSMVTFPVYMARWDLDSVLPAVAEEWVYIDAGTTHSVQQMTFNTPVNAAASAQCGKVVFSDFHVTNNAVGEVKFPTECTANAGTTVTGELVPFTPQERALEYMLFNLASCVSTNTVTGTCTKLTCASYPAGTCGPQSDGCGGSITCTCGDGGVCGAGGSPERCGPACTPRSCSYYGADTCGTQSDGCGSTITCPGCDGGSSCGGGGVAGQCGACTPKTCAAYPGTCGEQANGCGGLTANCGSCTYPATCGGGGVPNVCGVPDAGVCTTLTCSAYPAGTCGQQSDGCGGTIPCATCPPGETCGGGGVPNVCGASDAHGCVPLDCTAYPTTCGPQADGCGGLTAFCNPCTAPATCGGSGTPGVCGSGSCVPTTCAAQGITCGPAGDGCGATLDCGTCTIPGQTCGGGGVPGACGGCTPLTCSSPGVGCGINGNGCGGEIDCTCPAGQTCGGGGVAGVCGSSHCAAATCTSLSLQCGYESDGCGGLLDCGTCPSGSSCVSGTCVSNAPH